jgi:hypothetical protein
MSLQAPSGGSTADVGCSTSVLPKAPPDFAVPSWKEISVRVHGPTPAGARVHTFTARVPSATTRSGPAHRQATIGLPRRTSVTWSRLAPARGSTATRGGPEGSVPQVWAATPAGSQSSEIQIRFVPTTTRSRVAVAPARMSAPE